MDALDASSMRGFAHSQRDHDQWYRELLARFEGVNGRAREVAVLRFLLAEDDLDLYIANRSLKNPEFGVLMNTPLPQWVKDKMEIAINSCPECGRRQGEKHLEPCITHLKGKNPQ